LPKRFSFDRVFSVIAFSLNLLPPIFGKLTPNPTFSDLQMIEFSSVARTFFEFS